MPRRGCAVGGRPPGRGAPLERAQRPFVARLWTSCFVPPCRGRRPPWKYPKNIWYQVQVYFRTIPPLPPPPLFRQKRIASGGSRRGRGDPKTPPGHARRRPAGRWRRAAPAREMGRRPPARLRLMQSLMLGVCCCFFVALYWYSLVDVGDQDGREERAVLPERSAQRPAQPASTTEAEARPLPAVGGAAGDREALAGVFVLGMHRSGTSLVTGLLSRSGFWAADEASELLGADGSMEDNKKGFYERLDFLHQNDYLLKHQGVHWSKDLMAFDSRTAVRAREQNQRMTDWWGNDVPVWSEGLALLPKLEDPQRQPFVLKDPRACATLRVWRELLRGEAAALLITRHPLEVSRSLQRREGFPAKRSFLLWLAYNRLAIENSRGLCVVRADNADVIARTLEEMRRIVRELRSCGVPLPPGAIRAAEVDAWVDPAMQHAPQRADCGAGTGGGLRGERPWKPWLQVRDPDPEKREVADAEAEAAYDAAMRLYCDIRSGAAMGGRYDFDRLFAAVPFLEAYA